MDSPVKKTPCGNSTYGCTFASSSVPDTVKHFQSDCAFHPLQCFKCGKMMRKVNFQQHYERCCRDNTAAPCPAPEEAPDVAEAEAHATASKNQHSVQERVTACTSGVDRSSTGTKPVAAVGGIKGKQQDPVAILREQRGLTTEVSKFNAINVVKVNKVLEDVDCLGQVSVRERTIGGRRSFRPVTDVVQDVAEVRVVEGEQHRLEAIVKEQGDLLEELRRSLTVTGEKVNKLEFWSWSLLFLSFCLSSAVCYLQVRSIVERVEKMDGVVRECAENGTLTADSLSHVKRDVAAEAAEVKALREKQQELEATVRDQDYLIRELGRSITMAAEKANKVQEVVDVLVKEVAAVTRRLDDQNKVYWYVQNVSQYVAEAETTGVSLVKSDVFVIRGYSIKLLFEVLKTEVSPAIGLYLSLCRGPNDSLLQWPFRIPCTLSLVHPKDVSKTKEHDITPPSTANTCFQKPESEENVGIGKAFLCTVEAALSQGFIEDDAVTTTLALREMKSEEA